MNIYTIMLCALQTVLSQCKIKEKLNYVTHKIYNKHIPEHVQS